MSLRIAIYVPIRIQIAFAEEQVTEEQMKIAGAQDLPPKPVEHGIDLYQDDREKRDGTGPNLAYSFLDLDDHED